VKLDFAYTTVSLLYFAYTTVSINFLKFRNKKTPKLKSFEAEKSLPKREA
jgi:hypothetical protein